MERVEKSRAGMTHDKLVEKAANFLKYKKNCSVVLTEMDAATRGGETPDVIGWNNNTSFLIECKTSRSDYHAEKYKRFRKISGNHKVFTDAGMGFYRYYFVPKGLVKATEIPDNWGLVYLNGRSYKEVVSSDCDFHAKDKVNDDYRINKPTISSLKNEISMLTSALRRITENGNCKYLK